MTGDPGRREPAAAGRQEPAAGSQEPVAGSQEPAAGEGEAEGGFSRRAVAWMATVAGVSLLAAVLVSALGADLGTPSTARPTTFSEGALGHRALFELLAAEGLGVVTRQSRAAMGIGPRCPLVLAEPEPDADARRGAGVRRPVPGGADDPYERDALARQAAVVLVLPKWRGEPDPRHPGWVSTVELLPVTEVLGRVERTLGAMPAQGLRLERLAAGGGDAGLACRLAGADGGDAAGAGGARDGTDAGAAGDDGDTVDSGNPAAGGPWTPSVELAPAQLIAPNEGLRPVVACRGGWLAALRPASGAAPAMLLIADPDLLNNQGLGRADHAALAVRLLAVELHARGVVFDETIHGYRRAAGLLAEALRLPLLPATLHGLLVAALVLWAGAGRFGKPLPPPRPLAPGKAVLIDNTAELLARGGHVEESLAQYHRYTLQAVAAHLLLPPDLPPAALAARLAQLAPRSPAGGRAGRAGPGELAAIERRMARLGSTAPGRRREERAAALARSLHRWRSEMTDGTRQGS